MLLPRQWLGGSDDRVGNQRGGPYKPASLQGIGFHSGPWKAQHQSPDQHSYQSSRDHSEEKQWGRYSPQVLEGCTLLLCAGPWICTRAEGMIQATEKTQFGCKRHRGFGSGRNYPDIL